MTIIIRLQNLPLQANALHIRQFFKGLTIPDGGVHIVGGEKGDAFIAFATDEDARCAMNKNGEKILNMPIKLLLSSKIEMQSVVVFARAKSSRSVENANEETDNLEHKPSIAYETVSHDHTNPHTISLNSNNASRMARGVKNEYETSSSMVRPSNVMEQKHRSENIVKHDASMRHSGGYNEGGRVPKKNFDAEDKYSRQAPNAGHRIPINPEMRRNANTEVKYTPEHKRKPPSADYRYQAERVKSNFDHEARSTPEHAKRAPNADNRAGRTVAGDVEHRKRSAHAEHHSGHSSSAGDSRDSSRHLKTKEHIQNVPSSRRPEVPSSRNEVPSSRRESNPFDTSRAEHSGSQYYHSNLHSRPVANIGVSDKAAESKRSSGEYKDVGFPSKHRSSEAKGSADRYYEPKQRSRYAKESSHRSSGDNGSVEGRSAMERLQTYSRSPNTPTEMHREARYGAEYIEDWYDRPNIKAPPSDPFTDKYVKNSRSQNPSVERHEARSEEMYEEHYAGEEVLSISSNESIDNNQNNRRRIDAGNMYSTRCSFTPEKSFEDIALGGSLIPVISGRRVANPFEDDSHMSRSPDVVDQRNRIDRNDFPENYEPVKRKPLIALALEEIPVKYEPMKRKTLISQAPNDISVKRKPLIAQAPDEDIRMNLPNRSGFINDCDSRNVIICNDDIEEDVPEDTLGAKKLLAPRYALMYENCEAEDDNSSHAERFQRLQDERNVEEGLITDIDPSNVVDDTEGVCVFIKNFPTTFNYREVRRSFPGCVVPHNGLKLINDEQGHRTGCAYINFQDRRQRDKALAYNGTIVGENPSSVIEVIPCSVAEYEEAIDNYFPRRDTFNDPINTASSLRPPTEIMKPQNSTDPDKSYYVVIKRLTKEVTMRNLREFLRDIQLPPNGGPFLETVGGLKIGNALLQLDSFDEFKKIKALNHTKLLNSEVIIVRIDYEEYARRVVRSGEQHAIAKPVTSNLEPQASPSDTSLGRKRLRLGNESMEPLRNEQRAENFRDPLDTCCVFVRRLPRDSTIGTVLNLFHGIDIAESGIFLESDEDGMAAGHAYVEFANRVEFEKGVSRDGQFIGKIPVVIEPCSLDRMIDALERSAVSKKRRRQDFDDRRPPSPDFQDRDSDYNRQGCFKVHISNLHRNTELEDILDFFRGWQALDGSIKLQYRHGVPTGDGIIAFGSRRESDSAIEELNHKFLLGREVFLQPWIDDY